MRWDTERELSLRRHCTRTKNTIDTCINSATDRRSRSFNVTDFGTYRKLIYDLLLVINTNLHITYLAPFPSYGWLLVKFSLARAECLILSLSLGGTPANIAIDDISLKTKFCGLHFRCIKYWCIFNHFYAIRPESYRIRWNYAPDRAITPFKVIQGHRVWYQSKAHIRLPISD